MHGGVFIAKVVKDSPAAKAGISAGDVILEFNGEKVTTTKGLRDLIAKCAVGDKVKVVIMRSGSEVTKTVTLQEVPKGY